MATIRSIVDAERRRYQLISGATALAIAATAIAQHDERALLLPQASAPSAFAAITPTVSGTVAPSTAARTASSGGTGAAAPASSGTTAAAPIATSASSSPTSPAGSAATTAAAPAAATAATAPGASRAAFVPVTPAAAGTGAGSQQTTTTADAVGAVPEPESWLIMLLGIAGIGLTLRADRLRREAALRSPGLTPLAGLASSI